MCVWFCEENVCALSVERFAQYSLSDFSPTDVNEAKQKWVITKSILKYLSLGFFFRLVKIHKKIWYMASVCVFVADAPFFVCDYLVK